MKVLSFLIVLFLLIFPTDLALADSSTYTDDDIRSLLDSASSGDIITLNAGIYVISDQVIVPNGVTLQGTVSSSGDLLTKIFLIDNSNFEHQEPMFSLESDTKVLYLNFDGNSENQGNVPIKKGKRTGNGYNNFIGAQNKENIEVAYCNLYNNNGDGFRINRCKNITFHDNTASKGGHDVFYQLRSEGITAYNNTIYTRVNSALRLMDCSHVRWYNNYITTNGEKGTGLAMQIQHDAGVMEDIEVCNNVIVSSYGPGLWLVDKTGNDEELYLHHNLFLNCGYNDDIYWVGGIIANGYDNAVIENNVFDGSYLGAVNFWLYYNGWDHEATTTIKNNIFVDSIAGGNSNSGGWGVNNEITEQKVISENNCYYNNVAGTTRGCSVSSSDYFTDPRTEETLCDIKWINGEWIIPGGNPATMGDIGNNYDNLPDPTDAELEEFEFNSIFDVFNMEFSENGHVEQGDIKAINPEWETKGKYTKAYIYLAGFNDQITYNNVSYIKGKPSEYAIILTDTENLAPRPKGQTSSMELYDVDGKLKVVLKVKTSYEEKVNSTKKITIAGKTIKIPYSYYKKKHENVKYVKTFEKVPATFPVLSADEINVTIDYQNNSLNPHALITITATNSTEKFITGATYHYNGSEAKEYREIGYIKQSGNGFKNVNFQETNTWKFSDDVMSYSYQALYIKGQFDINKFNVTVSTPYDEFEITEFNYQETGDPFKRKVSFTPFILIAVLYAFLKPHYNNLRMTFKRMR